MFPLGAAPRDFVYFSQPCVEVRALRFVAGSVAIPSTERGRGPWVDLMLDSAALASSQAESLLVGYEVGSSLRITSIPIIMPTAPSAATLALEAGAPRVARPVLPHFTPADSGRWTARLAALPSVVRVDRGQGDPPGSCARILEPGAAGTFGLRLGVFLATLALWVPLYFWWALRQDRGA